MRMQSSRSLGAEHRLQLQLSGRRVTSSRCQQLHLPMHAQEEDLTESMQWPTHHPAYQRHIGATIVWKT